MSDQPNTAGRQRSWWPLVAVCIGIFMLLIDITVVNVALPDIERELGASFDDLQWVIDAYALTLAAFLLTAGSLGDRLGRRKVFVVGIALFAAASLACGFAQSPGQLSAFRAVQGIGGAIMFANSLALIAATYSGRDRGTAFGVWGATTGASVAIGPLVGGALVSGLSWRWIFFVNLPIGAVAIVISVRRLGESRDPEPRRVDWLGFVSFSGALALLVFALIKGNDFGWTSTTIIGELAGFAALLVVFVVAETRQVQPMFDLRLFTRRAFLGAQVVAFCLSVAAFSLFLYLTLYLQNVLHYSALATGVRLLPITAMSLVVAPIAGKLTDRVPFRILLGISLGVLTVGLVLLTGLSAGSGWTALIAGFVVMGLGIGQVGIATGIAAFGAAFQSRVTAVLTDRLASAHAPPGIADRVGAAVSSGAIDRVASAVPSRVRSAFVSASRDAFTSGLDRLFWIAATVAGAGAVLAAILIRQDDIVGAGARPPQERLPGGRPVGSPASSRSMDG
jgi:EmrB/QacA subfamily drug resistance transporter